jgi:hypothetical protein
MAVHVPARRLCWVHAHGAGGGGSMLTPWLLRGYSVEAPSAGSLWTNAPLVLLARLPAPSPHMRRALETGRGKGQHSGPFAKLCPTLPARRGGRHGIGGQGNRNRGHRSRRRGK